jgi:hypothetical protein
MTCKDSATDAKKKIKTYLFSRRKKGGEGGFCEREKTVFCFLVRLIVFFVLISRNQFHSIGKTDGRNKPEFFE